MIGALVLGPEQFWGLAFAFSLLLLIGAALLWVLGRMVDAPGPRVWGLAAVLVFAGMVLAGSQMQSELPWQRALYVLGDALLVLGIGLIGEGLRRFCGRRPDLRWVIALVALQLCLGTALEAAGRPLANSVAASVLITGLWLWIGWVAIRHTRRGFHGLFVGLMLCTVVEAVGWAWRGGILAMASEADRAAAIAYANSVLVAFAFVSTGALVLLYVLLVNFRLAEQLRAKAVRDPLTGALNRRGFEESTGRLASLSAELGQSVAVLMLDVDHFKQVNDQHGHHAGDLVLKALSHLVHRAKRETDVFARLGGEEFCLVLPGTDVPGARVFADRLRRSFETLEIDTGRSFLGCTMSVGVAYASASALRLGRVDVLDLLRQADEALYEAKRAGRNRVRFYASPDVVSSRLDSRLFAATSAFDTVGGTSKLPK